MFPERTRVTYTYEGDSRARKRFYGKLLALGLVMAACGLTAGLIPAPGALTSFLVLVPATISFFTTLALLWGLARMWKEGATLSEEAYRATLDQFQPRGTCTAVCAGVSIAGEALYVWRNGAEGQFVYLILFVICQAIVLAGAVVWVHLTENSPWIKQEERTTAL